MNTTQTSQDQETIERVLTRVRRYVEHETPSGDYARINVLGALLRAELEGVGCTVEAFDAPGRGVNLRARFGSGTAEPVVVLAHMDTVHPAGSLQHMPYRVVDGRVHGPGIYDMKTGIALTVDALEQFRASGAEPNRPVVLVVTCDEETGSHSSRALIEDTARGAAAVLVVEPAVAGGAAKTQRKGVATYVITVEGRAAHAGVEPERGINAIDELARQILRIHAIAKPAIGTTVSVDTIRGGSAVNVIPALAVAEIDVRYTTAGEAERIAAELQALQPILTGASVKVVEKESRPPLERSAGVVALFERARAVARELGVDLKEGSTGGGSDGCFTAALGIPTLDGLGTDGAGAHTPNEHIHAADLPFRAALLQRLLLEL